MSMKNRLRYLMLFFIVTVTLHLLFWPGSGSQWVEIDVARGSSAHAVAQQLMQENLIQSPYTFLLWVKMRGAANLIQVGRYRFSRGRSSFWIVSDLIHGRTEKLKFVIPEGYSSWQIADRLQDLDLCSAESFKQAVLDSKAEGYLFPATYQLDFGLSAQDLVKIFRTQFEKSWLPEFDVRLKEVGLNKHQAVTLASILEREIRQRSELPMVSALYNNRLKKNMRLEADPTVQYALGYWKSRLLYSDYRTVKSPYNTYLNFGLPPGPICSPGIDAIRAALWPAASEALFMLAQEDGFHSFSTTYREHTNKVNKRNRGKGLRK